MKSFGTLYHYSMDAKRGSALINSRALGGRARYTQMFGAGITSIAMAMFVYSYGPAIAVPLPTFSKGTNSVAESRLDTAFTPKEVTAMVNTEPESVDSTFNINIPFLKVTSDIIENVDPINEREYKPALERGVAHASGTGLPGQGKRIFLFAHSTNSILNFSKFNAIFYNLNNIGSGEKILIHRNGKNYVYEVTEKKVVLASDTQWLNSQDGEELILQTCYPPGTSWKRLLVFAKLI